VSRRSLPAGPARAVAEALAAAGTGLVFGVPGGGANLDLVGACEEHGLRFVLAHAETAAGLMGAAYGELTGRPGAALATRGPGAASTVNAAAHALLDRAPLVVVTDAVAAADATRVAHQRLDQRALYAPVTRASLRLGADRQRSVARAAVALAAGPPPGAVHVDVVAGGRSSSPPRLVPPAPGDPGAVRRRIAKARRPVVVAGVGVRGAEEALAEACLAAGAPVLTTYKAKGAVPESSAVAAGLLTGAAIEGEVLSAADLVVAVGLDPVELIPAPWTYAAPVVSIAPWPVPDPYLPLAAEAVGPLGALVPDLLDALDASGWDEPGAAFRARALARLEAPVTGLAPQDVVRACRAAFGGDVSLAVDAGAHMLVALPLFAVDAPRRVLTSSGLATMGFALPAAIAAALVRPATVALCLIGDGGLGMCLAELETVARLGLRVVVVVLNDAALSLIEVKQRPQGHGGAGAVRYAPVDFAAVAAGLGLAAHAADDAASLAAALAGIAGSGRGGLVDARVDPGGYGAVLRAIRG
jgi:acetolactate synthase-1/2/3 large subunit